MTSYSLYFLVVALLVACSTPVTARTLLRREKFYDPNPATCFSAGRLSGEYGLSDQSYDACLRCL